MGLILNIWSRRRKAKTDYPLGCSVRICMPQAWLDGKVGEVIGYDMFGPDIDLELRIHGENVNTTAPMKNCLRL